jgi:hypothetical protein
MIGLKKTIKYLNDASVDGTVENIKYFKKCHTNLIYLDI